MAVFLLNNFDLIINEIKQLNIKIDNLINNQLNYGFQIKEKYLFYDWLDIWFNEYKKPKLKKSSLYQIKNCINVHIKPHLENKFLIDLDSLDIQRALNNIKSSRMKKYTYDVYHDCLTQAYRLKYMRDNIMLGVENVIHKRKVGKALTIEEQNNFIKCIYGNKMEYLYKFYLLTGCRKSEPLTIDWADVDYDNKRILIKGTKTENSVRYIPLFPEIINLLEKIPKNNNKIFPYTTNAVKCNFDRLKNKFKFNFTIHSLRHTFTTRCLENGIQLKTIQKWLGHSKLDTTANIYAHIQTSFEQLEIDKFSLKI